MLTQIRFSIRVLSGYQLKNTRLYSDASDKDSFLGKNKNEPEEPGNETRIKLSSIIHNKQIMESHSPMEPPYSIEGEPEGPTEPQIRPPSVHDQQGLLPKTYRRSSYARPLGLPWNEQQDSMFKSFSEIFKPKFGFATPEYLKLVQTPIDYRPKTLKKWYARKKRSVELADQCFVPQRHGLLGADLAAAHFVVNRGGAVRFCGSNAWVRRREDRSYELPPTRVAGLYVEAIDAKDMILYYEGLVNIMGLTRLTWLSFEGCPNVDDWCLDRISAEYRHQLEYINFSDCLNVTYRGLSCFHRFEKLKTLVAGGAVSTSPEFKYACLLLEDVLPKLQILGVNYDLSENEIKLLSSLQDTEDTQDTKLIQ